MDESKRNRPDVGSESPPDGAADDPFARWSAARARVRDQGAPHGSDGEGAGSVAPPEHPGMEELRQELERERRLRASAEATLRNVAAAVDQERDRRRAAEERADAVFAELEVAAHAAYDITPQTHRRHRLRRALRRISARL
jgi:hypothetical protein